MLAYLWNYYRFVIRFVKLSPNQSAPFELVRMGIYLLARVNFKSILLRDT